MFRYSAVFFGLLISPTSPLFAAEEYKFPSLDFYVNYQKIQTDPFPVEFVFTNGANTPAFENFYIPKFYVADLNNDKCDDIFFDWADSDAPPLIFLGNKTGLLEKADILNGNDTVRTIREADFADINNDGFLDIIGFSISHDKAELGWGFFEPDYIALGDKDGRFTPLANTIKTESHAGIVADLDHDGRLDILPFNQIDKSQSIHVAEDNTIKKGTIKAPNLSGFTVFDADAADLNGDGLTDLVLSVMPNHRKNKYVSPERLNKGGSLFIYFGDKNTPLDKIKPLKIGQHWATSDDWDKFLKSRGASSSSFNKEGIAAPSNADLFDIDGDGDLDILVGYFVEYKSAWLGSGFQLYINSGGAFTLQTDTIAPVQSTNRHVEDTTSFIMDFFFEDIDRDGKKDIIISQIGEAHQSDADISGSIFLNRDDMFLPISLTASIGLPRLNRDERHIVPGDFNCDGKNDFATLVDSRETAQNSFNIYLARKTPLKNRTTEDNQAAQNKPVKKTENQNTKGENTPKDALGASCSFEITKKYRGDPQTYPMNRGYLSVSQTGEIQFADNQGYSQKGKKEKQFKTLLQDYADLTFTDDRLIGDFQTIKGSKATKPSIISISAPRNSGSFEGEFDFNYPGNGTGKLIIKRCRTKQSK